MLSPVSLLDFVEDCFRCDSFFKFVNPGIDLGFDAHPISDGRYRGDELCNFVLCQ